MKNSIKAFFTPNKAKLGIWGLLLLLLLLNVFVLPFLLSKGFVPNPWTSLVEIPMLFLVFPILFLGFALYTMLNTIDNYLSTDISSLFNTGPIWVWDTLIYIVIVATLYAYACGFVTLFYYIKRTWFSKTRKEQA